MKAKHLIYVTILGSLTSVDSLGIFQNAALSNLDALSGVTTLPGDLVVIQHNALTNLDGLSNITSVGGQANFNNNPAGFIGP